MGETRPPNVNFDTIAIMIFSKALDVEESTQEHMKNRTELK